MDEVESSPGRGPAVVSGVVGATLASAIEVGWVASGLAPSTADLLVATMVSAAGTALMGAAVGAAVRSPLRSCVVSILAVGALLAGLHGQGVAGLGLAVVALGALRIEPLWLALAVAVGVGFAALPDRGRASSGPRVLLVTVDGLRADSWPALRQTSDLAVQGRQLLGISPSPEAEIALDALHVGHMPWSVGGTPLAVRSLRDGCQTAAFVSRKMARRPGFAVFDDALAQLPLLPRLAIGELVGLEEPAERPAWETVDAAVQWLQGEPGCAFVWVHLTDPLSPLRPPPPWDARFYEGADPGSPRHPGLSEPLSALFPGIRDPLYIRALYDGEVGAADAAVGRLAAAAGESARIAIVGLGGIDLRTLEKDFVPQTLEVPVALHGDAPMLHQVVSLADVYGWLASDPMQARPWAVSRGNWGVRAAGAWRLSVRGEIREVFPEGDLGDRARRAKLLDIEQARMEEARD